MNGLHGATLHAADGTGCAAKITSRASSRTAISAATPARMASEYGARTATGAGMSGLSIGWPPACTSVVRRSVASWLTASAPPAEAVAEWPPSMKTGDATAQITGLLLAWSDGDAAAL